jgi:hypothetical protein
MSHDFQLRKHLRSHDEGETVAASGGTAMTIDAREVGFSIESNSKAAGINAAAGSSAGLDAIRALARDVYHYAYPIVLMDITMRLATNVPDTNAIPMRAPLNQFAHFRTYPKADSRDIVRFNFDTLYSFAWVDLSRGPIILSLPDTNGRYYLVPALDMWTDVFCSLGSRTTGTAAGDFAFAAPDWRGALPSNIEKIAAPTSLIWVMGRVQTHGPSDFENVHKIQDGFKLTPLTDWGKPYVPPTNSAVEANIDQRTPPLMQVMKLSGVEMFLRLSALMKKYPPHPNDYPILFRMRALGLVPCETWDAAGLDAATVEAIKFGVKQAQEEMIVVGKKFGTRVNGWSIAVENMGAYGTSYLRRAVIALGGIGANLPEDAIYPSAFFDGDGKPLDSANRYILHFEKGALPPAKAFWSITMYDRDGFQAPNPMNRFALGDRDDLKFNGDGSLDIYVQRESPGADKESNWLPAPRSGLMAPTMRIYSPRMEIIEGAWVPPPFKCIG